MRTMKHVGIMIAAIGLVWSLAAEAAVLGPLVTDDGTGPIVTGGDVTVGMHFTVGASDLTVDKLGVWDSGTDGLLAVHDVGLWDTNGVLVASVTVTNGTLGTLIGEFRYTSLPSPVVLTAGGFYRLGAFYPDGDPEPWRQQSGSPVLSAAVVGWGHNWGAGFSDPVNDSGSNNSQAYIGPNLNVIENLVPEPSSVVLLVTGFAVLARRRRRG